VDEPEPGPEPRRRVRRGEGEVTQWPRGLTGYVSKGPAEETPSADEDRVANRLKLAGRLIAVLRSQGHEVDPWIRRLREAEAALRSGDRAGAVAHLDRLLGDLERASPPPRT
jgi:hypothetical protein